MQSFHHQALAELDAAQKAGVISPLHYAVRRALREANMRGVVFHSADALVKALRPAEVEAFKAALPKAA